MAVINIPAAATIGNVSTEVSTEMVKERENYDGRLANALTTLATEASTYETNLAATTNGAGASLVGVEDAAGRYAGATVESVLADLGARVLLKVANATALQAIVAAARADGQIAAKVDDDTLWVFDSGSSAGAGDTVIVPDAGTGRWLRSHATLSELASTSASKGASLIGIQDAGAFTSSATVEAAFAEIYQDLKTTLGVIEIDFWVDADGDPVPKYAGGSTDGHTIVGAEAVGIRINKGANPPAILSNIRWPADLDNTANATFNVVAAKVGAGGDTPTITLKFFNQVTGANYDADDDYGGATGAMAATDKLVQRLTRTMTAADLPASTATNPAVTSVSLKVTDGTMGNDDLLMLRAYVTYKRKLLTA